MRNRRMRAVWMTLLFYALAGPLVGLLFIMVIGFLVAAGGPVTDQLVLLFRYAQSLWCVSQSAGNFDPRCFQRFEPRHFSFFLFGSPTLYVVVGAAFIVGFFPAFAGRDAHLRGQASGFGVRLRGPDWRSGRLHVRLRAPDPGSAHVQARRGDMALFPLFRPNDRLLGRHGAIVAQAREH